MKVYVILDTDHYSRPTYYVRVTSDKKVAKDYKDRGYFILEEEIKESKVKKLMRYIAAFLSGALAWHILELSITTLFNRQGTLGGEVLVLPLLVLTFYMGWTVKDEIENLKRRENTQC